MGSKYAGWKYSDTSGYDYASKMPTRVHPYLMWDPTTSDPVLLKANFPGQHYDQRDANSKQEWINVAGSSWMTNEFPGGIPPVGEGMSFDCSTECAITPDSNRNPDGGGKYHKVMNPNHFFKVRKPGFETVNQERIYYDTIDLCRSCRQKCCQRACCDGDDDDSWTWGCDVFRQKTNPTFPTPAVGPFDPDGRPLSLAAGDMDPYLYGLETGGREKSYADGTYDQDTSMYGYMYAGGNPYQFGLDGAGNTGPLDVPFSPTDDPWWPFRLGYMHNDQPWDNECEVATELACDYIPGLSDASMQMDIVFGGTLETFPVGQVQVAFASAIGVPAADVDVHVEAGSVLAKFRVRATPDRLAALQAIANIKLANASAATQMLGLPVVSVQSAALANASPAAPPLPPHAPPKPHSPPPAPDSPPATTVHEWTVFVRGTPSEVDMDRYRSVASINLKTNVGWVEATATLDRPGVSRVDANVKSERPRITQLIDRYFGSVGQSNATLGRWGIYVMEAPSPPPSPPMQPIAEPCAANGDDDTCSPFVGATWSAQLAEYFMYLYDETDDGTDLRVWEWPRTTPSDNYFHDNGFCEDGQPAVNTSIPSGEYYIAFGGSTCATMWVNLTTGYYSGCGKVALVPCTTGTDCADCGRSASHAPGSHDHGDDDDDGHAHRRELQAPTATTTTTTTTALPSLHDPKDMLHLRRVLKTASAHHLPKAHMDFLAALKKRAP